MGGDRKVVQAFRQFFCWKPHDQKAGVWIFSLTLAGYYFGNIPIVRENFSLVIVAIVLISVMPGVIEYLRHRGKAV
jgi:hypothetical protein